MVVNKWKLSIYRKSPENQNSWFNTNLEMTSTFKEWSVSQKFTRIILFKVCPGREIEVGVNILRCCKRRKIPQSQFRIFRLFGSFDLAFVQDQHGMEPTDFVRFGTIPYITGTSEHKCYGWSNNLNGKTEPSFDVDALKQPLVAFSFLKINPILTRKNGLFPEIEFADFILNKDRFQGAVQVLNTLGWGELILTVTNDNLAGLFHTIGDYFSQLLYTSDDYFAEKTLTIIGHTLNVCNLKHNGVIVPLADSKKELKDLVVDVAIACKPKAMGLIEKAAKKYLGLRTAVGLRFGPTDLHFSPSLPDLNITTINELRDKIDKFKQATASHLVRTHTTFEYKQPKRKWPKHLGVRHSSALVSLTEEEALKISSLGPKGESVATTIYRYANLTQTDIVADAFSDLFKTINGLKRSALKASAHPDTYKPGTISGKLRYLQPAVNQRSQNVYLGLEESPFVAYPGGLGIQRVFKSLEAYASLVLQRYGKEWDGFVCTGEMLTRFEHYADILIVPSESVTLSTNHWAITHELMHILANLSPETFSLSRARRFSNARMRKPDLQSGSRLWLPVIESLTDVLDFALCCPLSLDDYLTVIWQHLRDMVTVEQTIDTYESYLHRSFAVICYDKFASGATIDAKMFVREEAESIIKQHLYKIERSGKLYKHSTKSKMGEQYYEGIIERFFEDIRDYLPWIFQRVNRLRSTRGSAKDVNESDLHKAYQKLKAGIPLSEAEMQKPDAVAWYIRFKHSQNGSAATENIISMTWLVSLYHYYQINKVGVDVFQKLSNK